MAVLHELRQRAGQMAAPLIGVCIIAYFIFHAVQGERGIVTWLQLSQQIDETRAALVLSRSEERQLAHRVALLQPSNLDPDMLDERARAVLNLARPNESVTFMDAPGATD